MGFVWIVLAVVIVGGVFAAFSLSNDQGAFAKLGDVTGKSPEEVQAVVGAPTSISAVAENQVLYQWIKTNQAGGYHYALLFEDGRCKGFTHQHSS